MIMTIPQTINNVGKRPSALILILSQRVVAFSTGPECRAGPIEGLGGYEGRSEGIILLGSRVIPVILITHVLVEIASLVRAAHLLREMVRESGLPAWFEANRLKESEFD